MLGINGKRNHWIFLHLFFFVFLNTFDSWTETTQQGNRASVTVGFHFKILYVYFMRAVIFLGPSRL